MGEEETIREAMSLIGRRRSARKAASSAANIRAYHAGRVLASCNCGRDPHRSTCPVYRREAQRRSRAKKS